MSIMEMYFGFFQTENCTEMEVITSENLQKKHVIITPSTNSENITDIISGGKPFTFPKLDLNPTVTIDFDVSKILHSVRLSYSENVLDYDVAIIFESSIIQVFSVSSIFNLYRSFC